MAFSLNLLETKYKIFKNFPQLLISTVLLLSILDIFRVWYDYPITAKLESIKTPPQFAKYIENNSRIATFGETNAWNKIFNHKAWEGQQENYLFFKNMMDPNLNLIYGVNNLFSYAALTPR